MSYTENYVTPSSSASFIELSTSNGACRGSSQFWTTLSGKDPPYPKLIEEISQDLNLLIAKKLPHTTLTLQDFDHKASLLELGKILFILDHYPKKLELMLSKGYTAAVQEWINRKFKKKVFRARKRLEKELKSYEKDGIFSQDELYSFHLPIELSELLITSTGALNIVIAQEVESLLTGEKKTKGSSLFAAFAQSSTLRGKFKSIKKPQSPFAPANHVIRGLLKLPLSKEISGRHAKQAVISALLSDSRQAAANSCFSAFLVIGLMNSYPLLCLDDLQTLIEESKLIRKVQNVETDLPFLLKLSDPHMNQTLNLIQKIYLKTDGGKVPLWKVPWIKHPFKIAGIKNIKEILRKALQGRDSISINQLWQRVAFVASKKNKPVPLYRNLLFYFNSETVHPLIGVWINTIAGMAEAKANSIFRTSILTATLHTVQQYLQKLSNTPYLEQEYLMTTLCDQLIKNIHFHFDPEVSGYDGSAFVLYDKSTPEDWTRIDSETAFQGFLKRILEQGSKKIPDDPLLNKKRILHRIKSLKKIIYTEAFIQDLKMGYSALLSKKSLWTPWINAIGHDASLILDVYLENRQASQTRSLNSNSPFELLYSIIDLARNASKKERSPCALTPVRILNNHAFSLFLGHPSLAPSWKNNDPIDTWIQDHLVKPGKELSQFQLSKSAQEKVIQYCEEKLLIKLLKIKKRSKAKTIVQFRKELLKSILKTNKKLSSIEPKIDHFIYRALTKKQKKQLQKTAIHFADTNWREGSHHLHFCFLINPGTNNLEIWLAREDGTHLKPLNQDRLLKNQTWEVFTEPLRLLSERRKGLAKEKNK